jgi:lysophospholipase L1-like esterase
LRAIREAPHLAGHAQEKAGSEFPVFHHREVVLDYKDLRYNPTNDVIVPSVVRTDPLDHPLGRYYLYYAPHDAPGGICLAYADKLEGPWKEYEGNPLIKNNWPSHYNVSHVSGPHAIWIPEERRLFLYFHGENDVTRFASSADGVHFTYEGAAVTAAMFDNITEASYARVFRYAIPGKKNRYIMLLMGNNRGRRRIYLAWSADGRKWTARREPFLDPPPGTSQVAQAWYFPWRGRQYVIYHGHKSGNETIADLHISEVDPEFQHTIYRGIFYDHASVSPDNVAQMSPCLLAEDGRFYLFTNVGPRLHQKIALATADFAAPESYLDPLISKLREKWPENGTVNIVFHGHSVPAGYFKTQEVRSLEAYPHLVRERLAHLFPHAIINVIVTAKGGENSVEGEARFARDVLALKPSLVFIDYGLNDRRIGLEAARAAWIKMITAARARDAAVILLTPTPDMSARLGDPSDPLEQHARQIRALASEYGVGLVDSLAAFEEAIRSRPLSDLMAQSNHPNAEGHRIAAREILRFFERAGLPRR